MIAFSSSVLEHSKFEMHRDGRPEAIALTQQLKPGENMPIRH